MNEELRKMLDSIKAKKQEVRDLCKEGKVEDAEKAKKELIGLQAQFDLLYDLEQEKLDDMQQKAEAGNAKKVVDKAKKVEGAFVNAVSAKGHPDGCQGAAAFGGCPGDPCERGARGHIKRQQGH